MIMQWNGATTSEAEGLRSAGTEALCEWLDHSEDRVSFDVDKAWHAVHFTLTGDTDSTAGLLGQVVLGGVEFGDEVGYGPARWLPAPAVSDVASALAKLTPEEFERRVDFAALLRNDIYPSIWDRDPVAEELMEYVCGGYGRIRDGYIAAASAGHGFIIHLG